MRNRLAPLGPLLSRPASAHGRRQGVFARGRAPAREGRRLQTEVAQR
jgi:hypothetical protein